MTPPEKNVVRRVGKPDALVPQLDQLRRMTPDAFRTVIAGMLERST